MSDRLVRRLPRGHALWLMDGRVFVVDHRGFGGFRASRGLRLVGSLSATQVLLLAAGLMCVLTGVMVRSRRALPLVAVGVAPPALAFGRWRGRPLVEWAPLWFAHARRSRQGGHVCAPAASRRQRSGVEVDVEGGVQHV